MRLFIGTLLNPANQSALESFTTALVGRHRDALRSVPTGTIHMTHVFCAEVPEGMLAPLCHAVGEAGGVHDPFEIDLAVPHVIFGGARPRLLVAPIARGADAIVALMNATSTAIGRHCPGLAFSPSKSPHVTLGRFRKQSRRSDGRAVMQTIESGKVPFPASKDRIERVEVIESTLTPRGPQYVSRWTIELD